MDIQPPILAEIYRRLGIGLETFYKLKTAQNSVYSNGELFVKTGTITDAEVEVMKLANATQFIDDLKSNGDRVLVTRKMGDAIDTIHFSSQHMTSWFEELRRLWRMRPPVGVAPLDIAAESVRLRDAASRLPVRYHRAVLPRIEGLLNGVQANYSEKCLLHGDPNFWNVVFSEGGRASLVDFDHATTGPREWDVANMMMVCRIANRNDLELALSGMLPADLNASLTTQLLRIRFAQTLVHTAKYIEFETADGYEKRLQLIDDIL